MKIQLRDLSQNQLNHLQKVCDVEFSKACTTFKHAPNDTYKLFWRKAFSSGLIRGLNIEPKK